jgi:succinoglycan biosynthesis protein ExoM
MNTAPLMNRDHITVCVCTLKRQEWLAILLRAVAGQVVEQRFTFDIVVVDNDADRSSEYVVRSAARHSPIRFTYDCEPVRNISLARNRAIRNAAGNLLAFIDDDELPGTDWLLQLHRTMTAHAAHGVLGPVEPQFPESAPSWLRNGRVFRRRRLPTGTRIGPKDARTGNVLVQRSAVGPGEHWFDPAFGRTGGEDTDFFARQFARGNVFVWCDEAVVTETIPPERCTAAYHVRRLLRAGTIDGERMRIGALESDGLIVRNAAVFCACAVLTVPALLAPKHLAIRIFQKLAYSGAVVAAYWGISILRYRE